MTSPAPNKALLWGGRVASALPVLALAMSASMKLSHSAELVAMFVGKFGYPESTLAPIAIVELLCTIIYVIPRTSVLGAVLLTAYLGGAVATHVRVEDAFFPAVALGVLVWGGLYLRDERIRALLPLYRPNPGS